MDDYISSFPNRTLCDVLEEMRKCYQTYNFAPMVALIEEAQSMGNRMEAGLSDRRDIKEWTELRSKLKTEVQNLRKKRDELKKKT